MGEITGTATAHVDADPDDVYAALVDVPRLPSWNATMTRVVEQPDVLAPGAEWVVEFRVLGRTWQSRATAELVDPDSRQFAHRSRTDDGNPSFAQWSWVVTPEGGGSRVTVSWALRPATFWRRVLLGRIRARQLARQEVPASLAALAATVGRRPRNPSASPRPMA